MISDKMREINKLKEEIRHAKDIDGLKSAHKHTLKLLKRFRGDSVLIDMKNVIEELIRIENDMLK